ncbi:unnamed protein product, partial [Agarophyton chilense]
DELVSDQSHPHSEQGAAVYDSHASSNDAGHHPHNDTADTPPDTTADNSPNTSPETQSPTSKPSRSFLSFLPFVGDASNNKSSRNGGGGGGSGGGSGDDDDNKHDGSDDQPSEQSAPFTSQSKRNALQKVKSTASNVGSTLTSRAASFVNTVPAQVTVALISGFSTIMGARVKAKRDKNVAERQRAEAARKRKLQIEKQLRQVYEEVAAPILKSAAKLAERLYVIADGDWNSVESASKPPRLSAMYSAYLLGRYLATVELLKQESTLLDYGFQTADRILSNILGRVQGVLCADDESLTNMQQTEHFFQPGPNDKPLKAGILKIPPRVQTALGEILLRRLWKDKYDVVDNQMGEKRLERGSRAVISYLEFSHLMERDPTFRKWYLPVVEDFEKLEYIARSTSQGRRRRSQIGSRLYFVQSGLLDLVEFFDPLPHAKSIPYFRRNRLQIGPRRYTEEQRSPTSLYKLYRELANLRDHRVADGDVQDRLRLPYGIEVYVAGARGSADGSFQKFEHGDCPFSQRVLITLKEMGIPFKPIAIAPDAKPGWYYLLNPQNRTPCIYHDGNVVDESGHIVAYLQERFPEARRLASTDHLKLARGTPGYTRFHPHFLRWLSGDESAKKELEAELIKVNESIDMVQKKNGGMPFLGGEFFSREDTAIAPMLHNVEVAGRKVKKWSMPEQCTALKRYLEEARKVPSFSSTVALDETIVDGYGGLEKRGGERSWTLADMPE